MVVKSYVDLREHEAVRARQGDSMWVLLNHVLPDKRIEFEHFLHVILMPAVAHIHPEVFSKTRVLHPSAANPDGTYTYIFLMDPLIPNADYNISQALHDYYPPELAERYLKVWDEALAKPQVEYDVIQSAW